MFGSRPIVSRPPEEILAPLDEPFRSRLLSMVRGEPQQGADGQSHAMTDPAKISPSQGMWIYNLCRSAKPAATLEIGLAYGYSTIFFLAAGAKIGGLRHTAIDPFQLSYWHGIGLAHGRALAPEQFRFIEERSDRAAIDLARSDAKFDVIFIDGNHRFDDVLTDFYLYAPLCSIGGHIILDDIWMNSIRTVSEYLRANRRDFAEVHPGQDNIQIFQKLAEDTRDWRHFRNFKSAADSD